MAGIGFTLKHMLHKGTISGVAESYLYAGVIGSGPWLLSVVAIFTTLLLASGSAIGHGAVDDFQVSVTYLMVSSLLFTSFLQLMFTRFIADCLYAKDEEAVCPNLLGAILLTIVTATAAGFVAWAAWPSTPRSYALLMITSFATLSAIWIVAIFASAIKAHRTILFAFALGYGLTVILGWLLQPFGSNGLLTAFLAGQASLLFLLLHGVLRQYKSETLVRFTFLQRDRIYPSLILTGFLYTFGTWCDKFVFWADALTGVDILGPLRASPLYDIPVFIGSLSMLPGMAAFLLTVETNFAAKCTAFFDTVSEGGTLADVRRAKANMIGAMRSAFMSIGKVQSVTVMVLLILHADLLSAIGISPMYRGPVMICIIASSLQVLFIAALSILFYLDARRSVLGLCALFALCNLGASWLTLSMGPAFFGYGLFGAVLVSLTAAVVVVVGLIEEVDYHTFMLQPLVAHERKVTAPTMVGNREPRLAKGLPVEP